VRAVIIINQDPLYRKVLENYSLSKSKVFKIFSDSNPPEELPENIANFFVEVKKLYNNKNLDSRREYMVCFSISRYFFRSFSFRKRIQIILFGKYKVKNLETLIMNLRFITRKKNLFLFFAFVLGLFHFPKSIFYKIVFWRLNDHKNLIEKLWNLEGATLLFTTNGLDNFYFIVSSLQKPKNIKYFAIAYSWDNISSKFILSQNINHLALWNFRQQREIVEIYKSNVISSSVLGSKMADRSYSFYASQKPYKSNAAISKKLIFLGMYNKGDEFLDLIRLGEAIQKNNMYWYSSIDYRPHPLSKGNLKNIDTIKLRGLGIKMNLAETIDLRNYGGVICLPTSIIFEVLVAQSKAVIYAPRYSKYRVDPRAVVKYKHFECFREFKPIPIVESFENLINMLKEPLPSQKILSAQELNSIFPKFDSTYMERISDQIIANI